MGKFEETITNKKNLSDFISTHAELTEFGSVLNNMAGKQNINTTMYISVGKLLENTFQNFLEAVVKQPIIVIGCWENEPTFTIKTKTYSNVTINLALISNIIFKHSENEINDFYNIYFKYDGKIDYYIRITKTK